MNVNTSHKLPAVQVRYCHTTFSTAILNLFYGYILLVLQKQTKVMANPATYFDVRLDYIKIQ